MTRGLKSEAFPISAGLRATVIPVTEAGTNRGRAGGLTRSEIVRIVNRYVGVSGGYLGDFTYRTHDEFYAEYCDLDLNPWDHLEHGTTRERFMAVLENVGPYEQARIIRGVLEKYPVGSSELRTESSAAALEEMAERLERGAHFVNSAPAMTSDVVLRALDDAEALIKTSGPISAVDRVHTALHGHLHYLCEEAGISHGREDTLTVLVKKLRQQHPKLQEVGTRTRELDTVLRGSASILDSLNTLRNNASVAHPNEHLLGPAEAQLVINVGRSLLGYIDSKLVE